MQFRLRTLFLLLFVFASALAAFSAWGLVIAPYLIALVMSLRIGFAWQSAAALCIALALVLAVAVWAVSVPWVAPRLSNEPPCVANLRQIGMALDNYHCRYGCFPPAYVPDAQGRPMHSWRVLILPFLGAEGLYNLYNFSEPWDGPHNRMLAANMPRWYSCPQVAGAPTASYVAITGPGTAWPGPTGSRVSDFCDGSDQTILLVEATDAGIGWMEPRDLKLSDLLAQGGKRLPIPMPNHDGRGHILFAGGSVGHPDKPLSNDLLAALATINGSEAIDLDEDDKTLVWMPHWRTVRAGQVRHAPAVWPPYLAAVVFLVSLILLVSRPLPPRRQPDSTDGNGQDSQD